MTIFKAVSKIRQLMGLRDDPVGQYEVEVVGNSYGATAAAGTGVVLDVATVTSGRLPMFLLPTIGSVEHRPVGVILSDIAANGSGRVLFCGDCEVLLDSTAIAVVAGDALTLTTLGKWREAIAGERVFAYAKATGTASTLCRAVLVGNGGGGQQLNQSGTFLHTDLSSTAVVTAQTISTRTVTVTGLISGQIVVVNAPASGTNATIAGVRSGTDLISIDFINPNGANAAIATGTYYYCVLK